MGINSNTTHSPKSYLSRLPARSAVFDEQGRRWKLHEFLQGQTGRRVDAWVEVGTRWRVRLRLVAWRVPAKVAEVRRQRLHKRAQKSGRPASVAQRVMCDWNVLVTNATAEQLSVAEVCVLARLRWQVEWLFRLWKSGGGLDESAGAKPYRVLCELLAKLLGLVVQHWLLLTAEPGLERSQARGAKRVRARAARLAEVVGVVGELLQELQKLQKRLRATAGKQKRRAKPAAFQLVEDPAKLEPEYAPAA